MTKKSKTLQPKTKKAQADYEAAKKAVEAKNAKIDADYAAAKKAYDAKLAQVTASNKAKQDAYDKALADYKAGKLDTVTNKEKTLTMTTCTTGQACMRLATSLIKVPAVTVVCTTMISHLPRDLSSRLRN